MRKALFLDRDGVIVKDKGYMYRCEDIEWVPGILQLCLQAQKKDYLLIVITNQSGIGRELFTRDEMEQFHLEMDKRLQSQGVRLSAIYHCPHHPDFTGVCLCRKPGSLMLEKACARFKVDVRSSFMVGDKAGDIEAGKRIGCKTVYIGDYALPQADLSFMHPDELLAFI